MLTVKVVFNRDSGTRLFSTEGISVLQPSVLPHVDMAYVNDCHKNGIEFIWPAAVKEIMGDSVEFLSNYLDDIKSKTAIEITLNPDIASEKRTIAVANYSNIYILNNDGRTVDTYRE